MITITITETEEGELLFIFFACTVARLTSNCSNY